MSFAEFRDGSKIALYSNSRQLNINIYYKNSKITALHVRKQNSTSSYGPRQANLVLIAYASSEGSGEPAHPRSLARTFATRSYKQWVKRNLQSENQMSGPSECLGMAVKICRRHKFAWRGSYIDQADLEYKKYSVWKVYSRDVCKV